MQRVAALHALRAVTRAVPCAAAGTRRCAAASTPVPFLSAAGPPLCELPHAHDTHVAVAVAPFRVRLADGYTLTIVAPTDPGAVETMHALLGEPVDAVWAEVWPSAVAMADELLVRPWLVAGERGACACKLLRRCAAFGL